MSSNVGPVLFKDFVVDSGLSWFICISMIFGFCVLKEFLFMYRQRWILQQKSTREQEAYKQRLINHTRNT